MFVCCSPALQKEIRPSVGHSFTTERDTGMPTEADLQVRGTCSADFPVKQGSPCNRPFSGTIETCSLPHDSTSEYHGISDRNSAATTAVNGTSTPRPVPSAQDSPSTVPRRIPAVPMHHKEQVPLDVSPCDNREGAKGSSSAPLPSLVSAAPPCSPVTRPLPPSPRRCFPSVEYSANSPFSAADTPETVPGEISEYPPPCADASTQPALTQSSIKSSFPGTSPVGPARTSQNSASPEPVPWQQSTLFTGPGTPSTPELHPSQQSPGGKLVRLAPGLPVVPPCPIIPDILTANLSASTASGGSVDCPGARTLPDAPDSKDEWKCNVNPLQSQGFPVFASDNSPDQLGSQSESIRTSENVETSLLPYAASGSASRSDSPEAAVTSPQELHTSAFADAPDLTPEGASLPSVTAAEDKPSSGSAEISGGTVTPGLSADAETQCRSSPVVVPRGVWYNRSTCCWLACVSGVGKRLYVFSAKRLGFERARQMAIDCKNGQLSAETLAAVLDESTGGRTGAPRIKRRQEASGESDTSSESTWARATSDEWRRPNNTAAREDWCRVQASNAELSKSRRGGILSSDGLAVRDDEDSLGVETPSASGKMPCSENSQECRGLPSTGEARSLKEGSTASSLISDRTPRKRLVSRRIADTHMPPRNTRPKLLGQAQRQQDDWSLSGCGAANKNTDRSGTPHGVWFNSHTKSWTCATVGPRRQLLVFSSARYGFENAREMAIAARVQSMQALQEQTQAEEAAQCRSPPNRLNREDSDGGWSRTWASQGSRSVSEDLLVCETSDAGTPRRPRPRPGRHGGLSAFVDLGNPLWAVTPSNPDRLARAESTDSAEVKQMTEKEQQLLTAGRLATSLVLSDLLEVCLPQLQLTSSLLERVESCLKVTLWTVSSAQDPSQLQSLLSLFSCCFRTLKTPSNMPVHTRVRLLEALTGSPLDIKVASEHQERAGEEHIHCERQKLMKIQEELASD
ncbi:ap2 domain transcription factor ap2viia-3 [Cystoisospora suis]|uniref:Ap2 domain transcription factor ap2viia-3 n=1 Tax=Cystoisospora suis TaxID=483139 RepID=A0A2C6LHU5_9APIC|nr:ap2 domain transcription factor ap2viia-3 [Cystoisospora suis]